MLQKEIQVEIDVLHRQGKTIRAIERETGHSRNTIRAVLRGQCDGQYGPRWIVSQAVVYEGAALVG